MDSESTTRRRRGSSRRNSRRSRQGAPAQLRLSRGSRPGESVALAEPNSTKTIPPSAREVQVSGGGLQVHSQRNGGRRRGPRKARGQAATTAFQVRRPSRPPKAVAKAAAGSKRSRRKEGRKEVSTRSRQHHYSTTCLASFPIRKHAAENEAKNKHENWVSAGMPCA